MPPLVISEPSLVVLVGIPGAGKSTFAAARFGPAEVVSLAQCRTLVGASPDDPSADPSAWSVLRTIASERLRRGLLTVVDAPNVLADTRRELVRVAKERDLGTVAIVLDVGPEVAAERRPDVPSETLERAFMQLRGGLPSIDRERFLRVHVLDGPAEIAAVEVRRRPLREHRTRDHGPFDIVGDVHGCYRELLELLDGLGYAVTGTREDPIVRPPPGRRLLFLGDLVDRGPDSPGVLRIAMSMVDAGAALCVPGNHEAKLLRALTGHKTKPTHGLAETLAQFEREPPDFAARVVAFIERLTSHYVLDDGRLVVAHAGLHEVFHGRSSGRVRSMCLYGDVDGTRDANGLPNRRDWAAKYRGRAAVVYGHTPMREAVWRNETICIDTGCVFGGRLTALRYPERGLVDVPAHETYYVGPGGWTIDGDGPSSAPADCPPDTPRTRPDAPGHSDTN